MRHGRKTARPLVDGYKRHVGRDLDSGLAWCAWMPLAADLACQPVLLVELHIDRGRACVQVEHVVDQAAQALRLCVDVGGVLSDLLPRQILVTDDLAETLNACERRAELMADDRDKVALDLVQTSQHPGSPCVLGSYPACRPAMAATGLTPA